MAREEKGTKKAVKKSTTKAVKSTAKKVAPKKKTREYKVEEQKPKIISFAYMFFLMIGVALAFVAITLKVVGDIDSSLMFVCLIIALVFVIMSSFFKRICEK